MTTAELVDAAAEQRRELVAMARDFAQQEILPHAAAWDRDKIYPAEVIGKLGALGFLGMLTAEEFDGLGLDTLTYLMIVEEIAAGDASVSITLSVHNSLPSYLLQQYGTGAQRDQWLRPMARGEKLAAFCVSEADSGSDLKSARAQATWDGSGWTLTGTKAWVTNGDTADVLLVLARTDTSDDRRGARGLSFFVVPADAPGVEPSKSEDKMGLRASRTNQIALHDVRLGPDALVGEAGRGFYYAMEGLDNGRLGVGAQAVGIARAALDHALAYAMERKQFDKPIREFQAVQFMLADMAARVSAARALLHDVARDKDRGRAITGGASMAKLVASEAAMWVTTTAVQVFGGYGYMRDYPVERLFRDAKVTEIYEGTSEVQRIVIARELYARGE